MAKIFDATAIRLVVGSLNDQVTLAGDYLMGAIRVEAEKSYELREAEKRYNEAEAELLLAAISSDPVKDIPKSTKAFDIAVAGVKVRIARLPDMIPLTQDVARTYKAWFDVKTELERSKVAFDAAKAKIRHNTALMQFEE